MRYVLLFPALATNFDRYSAFRDNVRENLGINGYGIHVFLHWYLHEIIGDTLRGGETEQIYEKIGSWAKKIGLGNLLTNNLPQSM